VNRAGGCKIALRAAGVLGRDGSAPSAGDALLPTAELHRADSGA
jgi:hypothetical protein